MTFPDIPTRTVLITGCSSGIGAASAELLRRRGWTVIPTARKAADLERLRQAGFQPVALDVGESASVQQAVAETLRLTNGQLGALVNNAGYGQPGAVEDVSREALRRQFEVNLFGMQELTNAFIPLFRRQGYGRIVNVSSMVGRTSLPFFGAYSATKFAMEAVSDALRIELRGSGIAVSLIEPGPIATAFGNNAVSRAEEHLAVERSRFANLYRQEMLKRKDNAGGNRFTRPPEAVARKILHALESGRPHIRYCVTFPAYLGAFTRRFLPTAWVDYLYAINVPRQDA
jgi:NAD(P)-dependent dehydrogenase (short-subunit alcohol dehydrogenase family)